MAIDRRAFVAALPFSVLPAGFAQATAKREPAPDDDAVSWDGTWSGNWGGQEWEATSITISNNQVVSFEYHGVSTPISASAVTPTTVSYEHNGVTVTLTRTGATTAMATLHSWMGDATARLTRQ
jgi:hypothetical protein